MGLTGLTERLRCSSFRQKSLPVTTLGINSRPFNRAGRSRLGCKGITDVRKKPRKHSLPSFAPQTPLIQWSRWVSCNEVIGTELNGRLSGNPAAALATGGVGEGAKMLQDRIAAAEAAMGAQKSQGSISSDTSGSGGGATAASPAAGGSTSAGSAATNPISWPGRRVAPRWHQKQPCDSA